MSEQHDGTGTAAPAQESELMKVAVELKNDIVAAVEKAVKKVIDDHKDEVITWFKGILFGRLGKFGIRI